MKLYRVKGCWYGTQAEAKTAAKEWRCEWHRVEVPTMPKEEFVNWLNENWSGEGSPELVDVEPATIVNTTCPRCKWDQKSAERYAQQQAKAAQTDARIEWIEDETDPWTLGRLAGAVAVRFDKMVKNADRTQS